MLSAEAVGNSCAAALSDLMGNGFAIVNITPGAVGFGSGAGRGGTAIGSPQITYTLVKGHNPH